jgi:hypothetical protein
MRVGKVLQPVKMMATIASRSGRRFSHPSAWALAPLCVCFAVAPSAMGQVGAPPGTSHPTALLADTATASATQTGQPDGEGQAPIASATLQQCVTAVAQDERSATFSGEMTATSGTVRMEMRIDVQEQRPAEALFHTINAPGLGVWRSANSGVKTYRYLKQVTNLSAPAFYRAAVRFRWLNASGRLIRFTERHTSRCEQPAPPPTSPSTSSTTGASSWAGASSWVPS